MTGRGAGDGDPLRRIARLVEQARRRMSPERAFALLTACEDLLDDKTPPAIHVEAGAPLMVGGPQGAKRGLERLFGAQMPLFDAAGDRNP